MNVLAITWLAAAALASPATDMKRVMCTLPVLKSITDELSGGAVEATALSKPDQDPHFVSPTPSLMKRLREAELFVEIGLQLEIWAEDVATGSGNPGVARGGRGDSWRPPASCARRSPASSPGARGTSIRRGTPTSGSTRSGSRRSRRTSPPGSRESASRGSTTAWRISSGGSTRRSSDPTSSRRWTPGSSPGGRSTGPSLTGSKRRG
ncbi:MAG: zinc ABC transporter substrate-binding protein [Acidobacteria bacterium]|nr:zinc ABC transporter substrate-binding protein [Acidobacteriota bacterium]